MNKKHIGLSLLLIFVLDAASFAGLGSDKTMYMGGTVNTIKEGTEGKSSAKDDKNFMFQYEGGQLAIPYEDVDSLEYGQKAGRRVGVAVVLTPYALFSKKRRHYLTISYKDENDKQQAVVFELGKDVVRVLLATLEARTGKKIEYQDEEARAAGRGN
jgi:hypothetical protein